MLIDGMIVTAPFRDQLRPGPLGVRTYVPEKCFRGYTMFSTAFGSTEYLIDMNGMVVHTWPVNHSQVAQLLPNGNLMAGNYDNWVEEVSPKGERLWIWEGKYHHDFDYIDDDNIVLCTNREVPVVTGMYPDDAVPETLKTDTIICVNRAGEIKWEFSFEEHIEEFAELGGLPLPIPYGRYDEAGVMYRAKPKGKYHDWAHCNTIEVLPDTPLGRRDERFRAGNILFSFRSLDTIGVADVEKNKVTWAWGLGTLDGQHQPTMTPEGTILIFDNGTARGYSVALEIDPSTNEEVWRYEDRSGFYSPYRAGVQRLPNGNTLIAESDAGRIFEVTKEKEVVWDYYNPFLSQAPGNQGLHVYRATRYTHEFCEGVMRARADDHISALNHPYHPKPSTHPKAVEFYRDHLGG